MITITRPTKGNFYWDNRDALVFSSRLGELYDEKDKEIADEKEICVDEANDVFKEQEVRRVSSTFW